MVEPSQAQTLAALLVSVPGICLGTDLPEHPERSSGGMAEPAPRNAPGCVSGGMVDTQDLDSGKPLQAMLGGFGRVAG